MEESQGQVSQQETTPVEDKGSKTPWLKIAAAVLIFFAIVNLVLFFLYRSIKPDTKVKTLPPKDASGFSLSQVDQVVSIAGYSIEFFNPRYEKKEGFNRFSVSVNLVNKNFEPYIQAIGNCDVEENGVLVQKGASVGVSELKDLYIGQKFSWDLTVDLQNDDQKVVSCVYAPQGSYDPKLTTKVVF